MMEGLFSNIRLLSPNANISIKNNVLEILLPKDDIIAQLKNSIPDNVKQFTDVEYTEKGIVIKVKI